VVKIGEGRIREHSDEVVRSTVEEKMNELLAAAASLLGRSACVLSRQPAESTIGQIRKAPMISKEPLKNSPTRILIG